MPLSVDRVRSSIPKGGTDQETWTYPSAQMVNGLIVEYPSISLTIVSFCFVALVLECAGSQEQN